MHWRLILNILSRQINLARLMVEKGDFDGAEPIYKRLLEHSPDTNSRT